MEAAAVLSIIAAAIGAWLLFGVGIAVLMRATSPTWARHRKRRAEKRAVAKREKRKRAFEAGLAAVREEARMKKERELAEDPFKAWEQAHQDELGEFDDELDQNRRSKPRPHP